MQIIIADLVINLYTFILAIMLLFFQENGRRTESKVSFLKLIIILLLLSAASAVSDIGSLLGDKYITLSKLGTFCIFAFDPFGFLYSLSYIDCYTVDADKEMRKLFIMPVRIFAILNLVVVTASTVFDWKWFYYYKGTVYHRGSQFVLRGLLLVLLCMIVMAYVYSFSRHINRSYRLPILLFPIIVAAGSFLQTVVTRLSVGYMATVLSCLVLLIYVQKRDVNMDYLTGVLNRRGLDMALRNAIDQCESYPFSAIMFDVDFFKTINDRYGHKVGDEVLECVADVLKETFGKSDVVGRYGGDEFCVVTRIVDKKALDDRVAEVKKNISEVDWEANADMKVSLSAGCATYEKEESLSPKDFMEVVDKKMYEEKLTHHLGDRRKR
jgi:diguanylate cyclase (GGDEF)-like protein